MTTNEQPVSERVVTEWGVKWSRRNQVGFEMGEDGVLIQEALTMLRSLLVERDKALGELAAARANPPACASCNTPIDCTSMRAAMQLAKDTCPRQLCFGEKQPERPAAAREADGTQFLRENLALLQSYVRDGSGSGDGPIALLVMQTTLIELARRALAEKP